MLGVGRGTPSGPVPEREFLKAALIVPEPGMLVLLASGGFAVQKLAAAQSSSAGRAVPSVVEARRLRQLEQAAQNGEAAVLYERGQTAEDGGKPGVAKIYYNRALKLASGDLRKRILARLKALSLPDSPK